MMDEISKQELIVLTEEDDSLRFFGSFDVNGEVRAYYRSRVGAADEPKGFKIVYVVK